MAGWSDYADFTSADTLRLTSPLNGIMPAIKAVNERCKVAGLSLIPEMNRLNSLYWNGGYSYYYKSICEIIQDKINQLLSLFVYYGDWTGKTEIPIWTEATILTEIGDASRVEAPVNLSQLSVDWLYQQYKIINKLTYYKESCITLNPRHNYNPPDYSSQYFSYQDAFDAAIAELKEEATGVISWNSHQSFSTYDTPTKYLVYLYSGYRSVVSSYLKSRVPNISCDVELYGYLEGYSPRTDWPPVWFDYNLGFTENSICKVDAIENTTPLIFTFTDVCKVDLSIMPTDFQGRHYAGFFYKNASLVYNFAVPGGFDFQTGS